MDDVGLWKWRPTLFDNFPTPHFDIHFRLFLHFLRNRWLIVVHSETGEKEHGKLKEMIFLYDWSTYRQNDTFGHLFRADQLYVTIFVVMNLNFDRSIEIKLFARRDWIESNRPDRSPTSVPKVFRLKLMIFNAGTQRDITVCVAGHEHGRSPVSIVFFTICRPCHL